MVQRTDHSIDRPTGPPTQRPTDDPPALAEAQDPSIAFQKKLMAAPPAEITMNGDDVMERLPTLPLPLACVCVVLRGNHFGSLVVNNGPAS